ncbi:hypothetical protein, partial [Acinetobacter baumannii]|uniref:hypothetical protein n=1 Tax=Acinetobacter baumannii TaxID=470 RepID=UPI00113B9CFB|nr:hypothetical protein [Acinetobacter baumannii]
YEQGIPLSLDQQAINVYAEHNDLPVAAHIFNDCIFALDNLFLDEAHKKIKFQVLKKVTLELFTYNNSRVIIISSS